jgi:hypothetical protein
VVCLRFLLLRAHIALEEGDVAHARELCDGARAEIGRATPTPQFLAALGAIEAMVTAAESGPESGLVMLADVLRQAVEVRCGEAITAALVDHAAELLRRMGDLTRAVRLLVAGDHWRGGHPRPMPECVQAERTEAAARATLGAGRHEAERAKGSAPTPDDALATVAEVLAGHSSAQAP